MNRLDRLTAMLIHLQTKRVVRAQELADRFGISLRTVYRDIRSLEEAGVPIGAEAGVGYFLTDYHLPPVMFTSAEASALLMGGKLTERWADASVKAQFESALYKIKSVLKRTDQEHLDQLDARVAVARSSGQPTGSGEWLTIIQHAIARNHVLSVYYHAQYNDTYSHRQIEPVGLYHYGSAWHLIGFCQSRQDYRDFRVDRIRELTDTGQSFVRRERLSLRDYLNRLKREVPVIDVTRVFDKSEARWVNEQRLMFGFQYEEPTDDGVRMYFQTPHLPSIAHWLLMFVRTVTIEQPAELQAIVRQLVDELYVHHVGQPVAEVV